MGEIEEMGEIEMEVASVVVRCMRNGMTDTTEIMAELNERGYVNKSFVHIIEMFKNALGQGVARQVSLYQRCVK